MGITDNNKIFTLADMKSAFEAGEKRGAEIQYNTELSSATEVLIEPDFNGFMDKKFFINVENK